MVSGGADVGRHDCAVSQIQSVHEPVYCFCTIGIFQVLQFNPGEVLISLEYLPTSCQRRNSLKGNMSMGKQCVCATLTEFCRKEEHIYVRFPSFLLS